MTAIGHTDRPGQGIERIYASPDTVTTTTSRIDRYRTKTKCNFIICKLLGTPNDVTSTENCNKIWNKGSKGLATTTQLYTAK